MMARRATIGMMACVALLSAAFLAACSDVTGAAEATQQITLSRDLSLAAVDSARLEATDTVSGPQLSAAFDALKDRITRVGCSLPTITVVSYAGSDSAIVDTLFLYIGPSASVPRDTLTGPTFLFSPAHLGPVPQEVWVYSSTLWEADHLLARAPHAFTLRAYIHTTHPITRMTLRVGFPLDVSYLN